MKKYLLAPGPTPVPEAILQTMAEPMVHHRTPAFKEKVGKAIEGLKYVFQTKNDVLIFTASGTGAMEGAVSNVLNPGDKAIIIRGGKFGERWGQIAEKFHAIPLYIDIEWGTAVDPAIVEKLLKENPDVKAVYTQLTETSTCSLQPVQKLGEIVSKTNALLVIDAISGLGGQEFYMDDWKVDICVAGSQKGLMLPPGHAYAAVSEKAWKMIDDCKQSNYYFDWKKYRKKLATNTDPYTGSVLHINGLIVALDMIKERGLENMFYQYQVLAKAVRAAIKALGLELYAHPSCDVATAIKVPESLDGQALVKNLRDKYGFTIAGGQEPIKGKIFRIAHMGYIEIFDIIAVISALEIALNELGWKFTWGAGLTAAQEVLATEYKF
ncbi:MAG: alanine--glyoxylate aminotransferase family protein [Candidatus Cloacimonetes bacterium]|nr:alanine--glyoxylate aminotransferase family protein [Candidatus Cloacimonadota bacterium]